MLTLYILSTTFGKLTLYPVNKLAVVKIMNDDSLFLSLSQNTLNDIFSYRKINKFSHFLPKLNSNLQYCLRSVLSEYRARLYKNMKEY